MKGQYGEPWRTWNRVDIYPASDGDDARHHIADCNPDGCDPLLTDLRPEDCCARAERIVACVNALDGMEPGDVALLAALVRNMMREHAMNAAARNTVLSECACWFCEDARELLGRLPK